MVAIVKHDLDFILRQIKIAEAHSEGRPLTEIRIDAGGNVTTDPTAQLAVPTTLSPYGLRTVDGSYNNLMAGRDQWGAADNPFSRLTTPVYRNETDDSITFGPGALLTDGNYGVMGQPAPSSMGLGGGTVVDADPRIISNLIVDQTLNNPAAIYAALHNSGVSGAALMAGVTEIRAAKVALDTAIKNAGTATVSVATAQLALTNAQAIAASAQSALTAATANAALKFGADAEADMAVAAAQEIVDEAVETLAGLTATATPEEIAAATDALIVAKANLVARQGEAISAQTALDQANDLVASLMVPADSAAAALAAAALANEEAQAALTNAQADAASKLAADLAADTAVVDAQTAVVAAQAARDATSPGTAERTAAQAALTEAETTLVARQGEATSAQTALDQANDLVASLTVPADSAATSLAAAALANQGAQGALTNAQTDAASRLTADIAADTAVGNAQMSVDAAQVALDAASPASPADILAAESALEAARTDLAAKTSSATSAQTALDAANTTLSTSQAAATAATAAVTAATLALATAQGTSADANPAVTAAEAALDAALSTHGIVMDGESLVIPNVAPDEGLSAPYNSWFTLFGQFFDHGLDLVQKGGNGTIYIPLQPDDPLYNPASPSTNFMVLTRTTPDTVNLTTPWVDQNQTYTSHSSHQLFLREYALVDGKPVSTGKLLQGDRGLATWADVKDQARTMLGIDLTDADVANIPLFVMDEYGEFVRGPNGFPQIVRSLGLDGKFGGGDDVFAEGNREAPISTAGAVRTGHAFLDDIAHAAVPGTSFDHDNNPATATIAVQADNDTVAGNPISTDSRGNKVAYDNELLDAHYITGDGRGNENIGLSAVHHIFHSEHNHMVDQVKDLAIASGDLAFLNEWLRVDVATMPTSSADITALNWDGERLFQAARFTTEMQYQHLVFEEFARKVQPDIDIFVFNPSVDINPAIFAEFAHVVYRFGHSMLRETVDRIDANGDSSNIDLFDAFLNPLAFGSATIDHETAAGAIVRGMTSQIGNEIDEFVTHVLRNQLVGIPLDLAALNIARGRDTGIPALNAARAQFKEAANGDTQLDPYTSWTDFALNLKNPASIVNFIAAYGTHQDITGRVLNTATANPTDTREKTVEEKRDAAMKLVFGDSSLDEADRQNFLNGKGQYAANLGGLNDVDLWVGGMAEKKMAFGGMLGSTFSFVFELQLENLQNADRFYYLSRVQGLNFLNELENNSFAKIVLNNTDLGETGYALPGDIFSVPDHVLYLDKAQQEKFGYVDPVHDDPYLEAVSKLVERVDANGDGKAEYIRYNGLDHTLIQGTDAAETIVAGGGDDSVWGRGGNDRIEAGYGVDKIHGGEGDDIITNAGTDIGEVDMFHGEEGNDVIHAGSGLALVFGNQGQDFIITGPDGKEAFGGTGNDFILGGEGGDFLLGNEGDDWMEAGNGFDTTAGDNSELNFNSTIIGHDVMFAGQNEHDFDAESGDDIMAQGESVMRSEGMLGFDWAIHKANTEAGDSDLTKPIFTTDEQDILRDRFDAVEALSGWDKDDVLRGDNRGDLAAVGEVEVVPGVAGAENTMVGHELTQAGVDRIDGLRAVLGDWITAPGTGDREAQIAFDDGNILFGGGGSDLIEGRGGNDLIDGDRWLNVRIRISDGGSTYSADGMTAKVYLESDLLQGVVKAGAVAQFGGRTLDALMLDRTLNPSDLSIVREVVRDNGAGDTDTAVFWDVRANYTIATSTDGSILVSHTGFDPTNLPVGVTTRISDGLDKLRNIEKLQFADVTVNLSPPDLKLNAFDPGGVVADNFANAGYANNSGTRQWGGSWIETGDDGSAANATGQIRITNGVLQFDQGNGASIERIVNLAGIATARLSYSANPDQLDDGEAVRVFFAPDGTTFTLVDTITGNGTTVNRSFDLAGPFTANAVIRFEATGINQTNEFVSIDNLAIDVAVPAALPSVDYETTFTEDGATVAISSLPSITDDAPEMASARIVLTNAQPGDSFIVGSLTGTGLTANIATVAGQMTLTLTGLASPSVYQRVIQTVTFNNTSENPNTVDRIIEVTVNDGFIDSNLATTAVNVIAVNDAPIAGADRIVTNFVNTAFTLPDWVFLNNDSDAENAPISVVGTNGVNGLTVTRSNGSTSITDTGPAGGSFIYTVSDGQTNANGTVTVVRDATSPISGGNGSDILVGDAESSTLDGSLGNDLVFAGAGNDTITWDANTLFATDGRDYVDGGAGLDTFDIDGRSGIFGGNVAETFRVYTRAAAVAAGMTGLNAATEIVVTRDGITNDAIIAELDNIEEITIGTREVAVPGGPAGGPAGGGDSVIIIGDFSPTSLNLNTITIDGHAGDDMVDISALTSAHRIVFRSTGGHDTIIGALRSQDVIELAPGLTPADYRTVVNANGTTTLSAGDNSVTFAPGGQPPIVREDTHGPSDVDASGAFALTARDVAGIKNLVQGRPAFEDDDDTDGATGIRDSEGTGNNVGHPNWGSADQPFIRLTEAHYGAATTNGQRALNPLYDGLDARAISNILGVQEADLPKSEKDANTFFMAFGQYFDHGLDFLPKGESGTIEIGGPGSGRAPGTDNPADLSRGTVSGTVGGVPQHTNKTSPFVDQNQAYGSTELVEQFLRESDGQRGFGAKLLAGGVDPSDPGFRLLPTLREVIQHHWDNDTVFRAANLPDGAISFRQYYSAYALPGNATGSLFNEATGAYDPDVLNALVSNFMGSGHSLLLDTNPFVNLLDHYVAGDGRANENVSLTAMHTIWARNHNFHVEKLEDANFGTPEEVFQAARMLNEAEYQRVVFDEFAEMLIGGIRGTGSHGHAGYNPEADAQISHEFASAVYRVGHSLIGETLTVLGANGQPKEVALFDAFLNPTNQASAFTVPLAALQQQGYVPKPGYEQLGASAILGGIAGQQAEEVDFNIVDAVRNDLVRINADLFAFNVARGRDVGLGSLNQIRMDLAKSQNPYIKEAVGFAGASTMTAYTSWDDFRDRNDLSETVMAQFQAAYPDLELKTEAEIAAFVAANRDIALSDGEDGSKIVKGIDRLDLWVGGLAEKHINGGMVGQTFWVVLHEQFDRLQEGDRHYYLDRFDNFDFYENFVDGQEFSTIVARNSSLQNLPEHIFETSDEGSPIVIGNPGSGTGTGGDPGTGGGTGTGTGTGTGGDPGTGTGGGTGTGTGGDPGTGTGTGGGTGTGTGGDPGTGTGTGSGTGAGTGGETGTGTGTGGGTGTGPGAGTGTGSGPVTNPGTGNPDGVVWGEPEHRGHFGTVTHDPHSAAGTVYALYDAMFDRASDAAGQHHWTAAHGNGLSLHDLAEALLRSGEGQSHLGAADNFAFVQDLYETALHRQGDADGVAQWVSALDHGTSRADVVTGFAFSPENLEGLRDAFEHGVFTVDPGASGVARLYYGLLDRAPDAGGLDFYCDLVEGGMALNGVAGMVLGSGEYAAKFAGLSDAAFVAALYDHALGRTPDALGAQSWQAALSQGGTRAEVAVGITQSGEAQQHLLPQIETGWHLA